ncbi:MAG: methyltransferase [Acidobacteriota bacterium]
MSVNGTMVDNEIIQRVISIGDRLGTTPDVKVAQISLFALIAQMISVAAELGIADLIKNGHGEIDELARLSNANPEALYRLMRALAGFGIFAESADKQFELTPLAECLATDSTYTIRSQMISANLRYRAWNELLHSVKTGEVAFNQAFGMEVFKYLYLPENAYITQHFSRSFMEAWRMIFGNIVAIYDFSQFSKIIDVGGNHGLLLETILRADNKLQGVLFDLPTVVELTKMRLAAVGLSDRCETLAGNFFESVPSGGDAYILSQVIHDWDDEKSTVILQNCRRAMTVDGKLLVIEMLLQPGNNPSLGKVMDVEMLVMTGGRERTEEQYRQLFKSAGLQVSHTIKTDTLLILEGVVA